MQNSLQNTLACAFDNIDSDEPLLLSCPPLDTLYAERGIAVTAWRWGQTLFVAVGFEGSSDGVYEGTDTDTAATAAAAAIAACA